MIDASSKLSPPYEARSKASPLSQGLFHASLTLLCTAFSHARGAEASTSRLLRLGNATKRREPPRSLSRRVGPLSSTLALGPQPRRRPRRRPRRPRRPGEHRPRPLPRPPRRPMLLPATSQGPGPRPAWSAAGEPCAAPPPGTSAPKAAGAPRHSCLAAPPDAKTHLTSPGE